MMTKDRHLNSVLTSFITMASPSPDSLSLLSRLVSLYGIHDIRKMKYQVTFPKHKLRYLLFGGGSGGDDWELAAATNILHEREDG